MEVLGWRAWYAGGTVYDSRSTTWANLPDDGALAFVIYFAGNIPGGVHSSLRRIMTGTDYYFLVGPDLYAQSDDAPEEITRRYPGAILKRGRWAPDYEMMAAHETAMAAIVW